VVFVLPGRDASRAGSPGKTKAAISDRGLLENLVSFQKAVSGSSLPQAAPQPLLP
jgi:hypothetical protein